jgi:hypothetical protein
VDATFAAFGINAVYTPAGGEPVPVRVIARRPNTIVGFGETRIHAEPATRPKFLWPKDARNSPLCVHRCGPGRSVSWGGIVGRT